MLKLKVFTAVCLFVCSFLFMSQTAMALSGAGVDGTAWEIFDDTTNAFTVAYTVNVNNFGIYEIGDTGKYIDIPLPGGTPPKTTVSFGVDGLISINGAATTTSFESLQFGFFEGYWESADKTYTYFGDDGTWDLFFKDFTVVLVNADNIYPAPVPIPTAALLLGSGLVGLVGFRRKIKQ